MESDRRMEPRFRPDTGCYIAYMEGSGGVRDLSLNGLFVLDEDPLPLGERVKFSLCTGPQPIVLDGIVVRSEPGRGMAIRLIDVSRESRRRLQLYFASLGPERDRRADQRVLITIT